MRKLLVAAAILATVFSTGCATVTMSAKENQARYKRDLALMMRQLGDDVDFFLLAHRPSRLTFYHTR